MVAKFIALHKGLQASTHRGTQEMACDESRDTEITPKMFEAALGTQLVDDYMFEFGLEDEPARMRELLDELWRTMCAAK